MQHFSNSATTSLSRGPGCGRPTRWWTTTTLVSGHMHPTRRLSFFPPVMGGMAGKTPLPPSPRESSFGAWLPVFMLIPFPCFRCLRLASPLDPCLDTSALPAGAEARPSSLQVAQLSTGLDPECTLSVLAGWNETREAQSQHGVSSSSEYPFWSPESSSDYIVWPKPQIPRPPNSPTTHTANPGDFTLLLT